MHIAALHLAPILGAEKSKVPFYIAGGILVAWALFVSIGLGLRQPNFPATLGAQRGVMAITAVLVLAAVSMAVITSGSPAKASASSAPASNELAQAPEPSGPAPAQPPSSSASPSASSPKPAAGGGSPVRLAASPGGGLSYNTKQLSAKTGKVTIALANMSPLEHNVTVAQGTTVLGATPTFVNGSRTVTLTLKPGTYTFYCSVPGHRQAGMEGTLKVS
jgi:plastocyanin